MLLKPFKRLPRKQLRVEKVKMEAERIKLEAEIGALKLLIQAKEKRLAEIIKANNKEKNELSTDDIVRFSRQIILPQLGLEGQLRLKAAKVLIIGVGGLGCPALLYLATAGVGNITIVDNDLVEVSNLHRQVLHSDATIGIPKVDSALLYLKRYYGSYANITPCYERFTPENASKLVVAHDIIVDASDNAGTRYLLNDECVRHGRPLVSGSALGLEGQVTVYNVNIDDNQKGPCYRCLFPEPPPAESAGSCSQSGVLGPGLIALIQTLEVIKLIIKWRGSKVLAGRMIILDANDLSLRTVKLRLANPSCPACGNNPQKLPFYSDLCGDTCGSVKVIPNESRLSPPDLATKRKNLLLIDVRSKGEFEMCKLEDSINFPFRNFCDELPKIKNLILESHKENPHITVCCICRRGNDSQLAAVQLQKENLPVPITDLLGGLHNWARIQDTSFPIY